MKVLIIGASGTVGGAAMRELQSDTEVITANYSSGDFQVDIADEESIEELFKKTGKLDAVIVTAARGVVFKPVTEMTKADYSDSLQQKLLGQITVALKAQNALNDGGSITLTTGCFGHDFVKHGSAASLINNGIEGFVKAAALEMPRGIRINVLSPALLEEAVKTYEEYCPGFEPVSSDKVGRAFRKSVYSIQTGRIYEVS
jgi:NAD(P)-dependent dehydrogenase (short-subunit alcohol dehydrogenase family)